ncbi:MAG: hypothetical protein Q9O74_04980, partial [Planctomycetota bacterium]|nr:hypothetical protein [Planctomycetota bacterium]
MPTTPTGISRVLVVAAMLAAATVSVAQDTAPPQDQPEQAPTPTVAPAQMHPGVLLGRRAGALLAARPVIRTVVIVPDPASYAEAIARWAPKAIYPVLIDDGSWTAQEDIARFVRGFQPEHVVRWQAPAGSLRPGSPMRPRRAVPNARQLADAALPRSWGFDPPAEAESDPPTPAQLVRAWLALGLTSPGVILADRRDPAWTAALALAAGRGQPILWTEFPALAINRSLDHAQTDAFSSTIESLCAQLPLPWQGLGDAIDAVTICGSLPARTKTSPNEFAATTDRLGRSGATQDAARWAWAGQIFGSEPRAAYRAMCALFLRPRSTWTFDGYASTEPWVQWDGTLASQAFDDAGMLAMLDDEPRNTAADWKLRAQRPVHAGLILINSSGNRGWFDLSGSRAYAGDVPLLDVPAAVHMVHSWSAVAPGRPNTVAGRWLERGVFAYIGSVHEPYLQAFVPTPFVAKRLLTGMAFGAVGRLDDAPVWRISVLGDPLYSIRPESPVAETELPLEDTVYLNDLFRQAATDQRYADLFATLSLAGRDSDAARLFEAMLRDQPASLDAEVARAALFVLFRTGHDDEFLRAFSVLRAEDAAEINATDALWHVGRRTVRER